MSTLIGMPMPQPGETITEGVVVRWIKQVGDTIAEKDPVVELETAKAVYEYESPIAGVLKKIIAQEGDEQQVGQPLALIECDDADAKKYLRLGVAVALDASGAAVTGEAKIGATAGTGGAVPATRDEGRGTSDKGQGSHASGGGQKVFPPFIRTMAKQHNLSDADLQNIPGTGIGGRLTKQDLENFVKGQGAAPTQSEAAPIASAHVASLPPPLAGSTRVEPKALRRRIAHNMILSKSTIPHAGSTVEVDMTDLLALRAKVQDAFQQQYGAKLRVAPFFLHAVVQALKAVPVCNHFYFIDAQGKHWIEEHSFMNLGVAVGTERGLIVPVLKGAERLDFVGLAKASDALMEKALAGKLTPDDLTGGTITINNPGALGSTRGNQIIAYPQSCILGFQAIVERACFVEGECVPRHIMALDMSFDHRLIDGVEAVQMLTACQRTLEAPEAINLGLT